LVVASADEEKSKQIERQESKNAILESETQLLGSNSALAVQPAARPEMEHCIARKRRDIMKSVEGWYSTCNNVFFYKFFVSMH